MDPAAPLPSPAAENRPRRNTLLLVLLAGGFVFLVCIGCIGGIFTFVTNLLKSSDVYTEALAAAQKNVQVQALLSEPITAGYFVKGQIHLNNDTGTANLDIPLSGPKGSTTLHAVAEKRGGRWTYSTLKVDAVDGSSGDISLLPLPSETSP